MIRLNDINKTVIDETKIIAYFGYIEEKDYCICIALNYKVYADYDSKQARDKDIELLDKLFDVKSIEDKVNEQAKENYPLQKCEHKKSEYLTWEDVKKSKKRINIKFSNGDIHSVDWDEGNLRIQFYIGYDYEGCIYEEELFNALMLKKVE